MNPGSRIRHKFKKKHPENLVWGDYMEEQARSFLFIINDSPYGNERPYNALRLALNLVKKADLLVKVFLIGDGVNCSICSQKTPEGFYNIERMIHSLAKRGQVFT
jgi:sulfur relay (sulfurtransferase) complex TusBCD TusD component (DsrE family)